MRGSIVVGACVSLAGAMLVTQGCGVFSSGDCTDKALCPDTNGDSGNPLDGSGGGDTTLTDSPTIPDVQLDNIVTPDGPLPEGSCGGGAENCQNGVDDNCDGKIDCADPLCQVGYSCSVDPPNGWTAIAIWVSGTNSPPACSGAYAQMGYDAMNSLNAPPAQCSCNCDPSAGESCGSSFASATAYNDGACSSQSVSSGLPPSFCVNPGVGVESSVMVPPPSPSGGSCPPKSSANVPSPSWGTFARTCDYAVARDTTGGCSGGSSCVAKVPGGLAGPCVTQAGDQACPSGYSQKVLFYTGMSDSRGCSTCTCGNPAGGTCAATLKLYSNGGCSGALVATFNTSNSCQVGTGATFSSWTIGNFTLTPGSCTPQGGAPTGNATPTGTQTVCCP